MRVSKTNLFTNLVLEGGGVRGIAFVGAIQALEELNVLQGIYQFAGSSAGSIVACLLSIKLSANQIKDIMFNCNFKDFKDSSFGLLRDCYRLYKKFGYYKGNYFLEYLGNILEKYTGNKDISFQDVYDLYGNVLVVTGTNLNLRKTIYFSKDTYPNKPIRDAIRISMGIPGFFQVIKENNDGNIDCYVDGGVCNNYPIWIFDGDEIADDKSKHCDSDINWKTLGLKLMSNSESKNNDIFNDRTDINNIFDFIDALIGTMCTQIDRGYIKKGYWKRTISINTMKVNTTDFNLSDFTKQLLIGNGYNATIEYFNTFETKYKDEIAAKTIQKWWKTIHSKSNIGISNKINELEM